MAVRGDEAGRAFDLMKDEYATFTVSEIARIFGVPPELVPVIEDYHRVRAAAQKKFDEELRAWREHYEIAWARAVLLATIKARHGL